MEPLNIIIADCSQLSRLGLISIIEKLGYPVNIKEIVNPEKLENASLKGYHCLIIISTSILFSKTLRKINTTFFNHNYQSKILIMDKGSSVSLKAHFEDVIDPADNEKTIARKIEKQIQALSKNEVTDILPNGISDREKDVLQLVALGLTNKEIAEKLFISTHTVITHRKNITAKLGIKTIAGLTVYAVINKLITLDELK